MRILHVSTSDCDGGAARAAVRLHESLLDKGQDSVMAVALKGTAGEGIIGNSSRLRRNVTILRAMFFGALAELDSQPSLSIKSLGIGSSALAAHIGRHGASVVNLHWVNGEALSVPDIARISAPCVWTLHDCWPFSGVAHYPMPDFEDSGSASTLPRRRPGLDIEGWGRRRKLRHWMRHQFAVAPSKWIKEQALSSEVGRHWTIEVIPNPLPLHRYRPYPRDIARGYFKIPQEKSVLVYSGSFNNKSPIKGWRLLEQSLRQISVSEAASDFHLLVIGEGNVPPGLNLGLSVTCAGRLADDVAISLAYSAADVALVPSLLDNLPQVATEAIASGVPVVAYAQGGMADIVVEGHSGTLVSPYDTGMFAAAAINIARKVRDVGAPFCAPRAFAERVWGYEATTARYLDFYREVIANSQGGN